MLVGMETRVKDVVSSLEMGIDDVRMIGIKGMGGVGKTTTARAVFDHLSADFEAISFLENVREDSTKLGLNKLQEQVLSDVLNDQVTVNAVTNGKMMMKNRMCGIKVLLVLDDVNHIDQLEALAGGPNWFKPGSRIIVTTRDEQVLVAHRVNLIPDINLLSDKEAIFLLSRDEQVLEAQRVNVIRDIALLSEQEAISLFSRHAFGRENPLQGYEELSGKVVRYAAGLPLTLKVLGSFLCGKDENEWKDAIERLKEIPLKETQEKLELSYTSLENDYKEIFLDIACILKGKDKEEAIRILECCGFRAINGLKVLEQRSLITISPNVYGRLVLGMHDHIEEMGKNIVRREHPDEPNEHSRLWINEEIEKILAADEGTEATICLKLRETKTNAGIVMKGLGKMKKLRYLQVLSKLKFLSLKESNLTTFDFRITPNLEALSLEDSHNLVELFMPAVSCQNLNYLHISKSKLRTFDLGLTPNLEELSLNGCADFEVLHVSSACPNLKFLSLSNSALTTFDFSMTPISCQNLNYLHISKSKLRTFDLGLTPNLEELSLNGCADFEVLHVSSACPNLKFLSLSNSALTTFDFSMTPSLETLILTSDKLVKLCMPVSCQELKHLDISYTKLRTFDLGLTPNLEKLSLNGCADFEVLHVSSACSNLKFLELHKSRFRSLDLELFPNLERLELTGCDKLVEINAPVGCLRKLVCLNLDSCLRFSYFVVSCGGSEPKVSRSSASLRLVGKSRDLCRLHPNSNLPKFRFGCKYQEDLPSSVGNIERLISFGLCACIDLKKFSDMICSLRCLRKLELKCDIPEFPNDLGQLEYLEELCLSSTKIKHLPDSICMLKCLKSLKVDNGDLLEKLPENLGQLECLEKLRVRSKKIKHLPDSICMLKCLKSLEVNDGDLLEKLPENLGQLECLEKLRVRSKKIEYLPDSICMLKRLTWLDFGDCSCLGKLPEDIGLLESLEILDLSATKIKHLPDSICKLKHLKHLCLWEEGEKKDLLTTFDFSMTPSLQTLVLSSDKLVKLCMPVSCQELKYLNISDSKLRTFDLGLTPNLENLSLNDSADFEELHVSSACPNLKFLELSNSRLRSLNLELFPNLERLDLEDCDKLVEIKAPVGCLRKLVYLNLSCLRFSYFMVPVGGSRPKVSRSLASLNLAGEFLDLCPLHPDSNLPKFQFNCKYEENLPSSVGNIEKLISFGLCACTDFKKFSDMICSLRCLRKLELKCDIPEFPNDLGQLEYLEELCLSSTKIKHLPDSICMLKCLKSLKVDNGDLLEKLPENLGQLECLEELYVRSKKIEYLPDSICMLKRLKSLDVEDCSCLGKLPEDIGQLESLERLLLSATKIKHLPDSICMLKHLTYLNLSRCALLEKLPEDLGQLECLEELYVGSTKIENLPDSICMLKRLNWWLTVRDCPCCVKDYIYGIHYKTYYTFGPLLC
ncbi:toll/interleukin-1 receptor (TIR) domain-containing protein [Artemisia annua]|uniref:Toll/interleukin-1 receptor (TIR) domain-containing protein n=1 Tax=Artemisia annua TaxID=35608 RepID=A0A2U1LE85_ARTAN|nr:toll/interleukin-1 receptor (TIR) domain-containing protein [Artemisia annua]